MRTNTLSTAAYYNEVSYGQQALNVTVACQTTQAGEVAQPNSTRAAGCCRARPPLRAATSPPWLALPTPLATAAGYTIGNYNNRFYVLPGASRCGWAGLAYVGFPYQAWSAGYNALWVYGHELGHNFTLYHAGSVSCGSLVLSVGCSVAEYGDRFDVMGNNTNAGQQMHFNATQKALLGWIPASSVVTHTSGTKTYSLSPLEAGGQSTYAVKIPVAADTNRTYWIEYRQPIGLFDATLSSYPNQGAIIHVAEPFDNPCTGSCFADDTEILDMSPANGDNFFDAALLVGQTYTDSTYGVSITVNSANSSTLSVTVSVSGAAPAPTTTTMTSSSNPSTVGASVTFTASVTGSNPTGNVNFTDGEASISGCAAVALTGAAGNTRSAPCSTSALTQGTHSIVASYGGDSGNAASASSALSQVVNASSGGSIDVALATNGGVASASSTYVAAGFRSRSRPSSTAIAPASTGGTAVAGTTARFNVWPDWVQINFSSAQTIDKVIVYTLQDNYTNPVDPPDSLTFTLYGVTAFQVQGWNGSSWVNLGAAVTGNNLVKRAVNFSAFTTSQIRVNITAALDGYSRLTEVEAWTGTGSGSQSSGTTLSSSQNPAKAEPERDFRRHGDRHQSDRQCRLHQRRQHDLRLRRRRPDWLGQFEDGTVRDELRCRWSLHHRRELQRRRHQLAVNRSHALRASQKQALSQASKTPRPWSRGVCFKGCLTMTYFRTGNPHYHRRATVSRSCSGWEGVVPAGCGRQALISGRCKAASATDTGRRRKKQSLD